MPGGGWTAAVRPVVSEEVPVTSGTNRVDGAGPQDGRPTTAHLARWGLTVFRLTYIAACCVVLLILSRRVPGLYVYVGQTHVHHFNYGIFLLSGAGAYLLSGNPGGRKLTMAAVAHGIGLALTFDEFGMWLHLGGGYWQRASFDAVSVIAGTLGLLAAAPKIRQFRPRHWRIAIAITAALVVFAVLLADSVRHVERAIGPAVRKLESTAPR